MSYTARFRIKGIAPYSQSALIQSEKGSQETHDAFENRVWRERMHADEHGQIFVPPAAIKNALVDASKYLGRKIPGQGNKTWTAKITSGVLCFEPILLYDESGEPVLRDDVEPNRLFLNADGKRGSGTRVHRNMPKIPAGWNGVVSITVGDAIVIPDVLEEHLEAAGSFIGIGTYRPQNRGYFGRFICEDFQYEGDVPARAAAVA